MLRAEQVHSGPEHMYIYVHVDYRCAAAVLTRWGSLTFAPIILIKQFQR